MRVVAGRRARHARQLRAPPHSRFLPVSTPPALRVCSLPALTREPGKAGRLTGSCACLNASRPPKCRRACLAPLRLTSMEAGRSHNGLVLDPVDDEIRRHYTNVWSEEEKQVLSAAVAHACWFQRLARAATMWARRLFRLPPPASRLPPPRPCAGACICLPAAVLALASASWRCVRHTAHVCQVCP